MKAAAVALLCLGGGLLAGDALADLVPVPTVPSVTVSVPSVPLPLPTATTPSAPSLPSATTPSAPSPSVTTPSVTAPSAPIGTSGSGSSNGGAGSTPSSTSGSTGSTGSTGSSGSSGSAGSSAPSGSSGSSSSASSRPQVKQFRSSRRWIATRGKKGRKITLTFVLPGPAHVRFTVEQLSPVCQTVGRFSVLGHAGVNRVRFAGRLAGRQLKPGAYRITAETPAGQPLQRVKLVVVRAAPTDAELAALTASNVCPSSVAARAMGSTGAAGGGDFSGSKDAVPSLSPAQPSADGPTAPDSGGILGSATVEQAAEAIRPALVALLVAAILLLGLASLPRLTFADPRLNEALARHRLQIAGVGAGALVAVILAFLLG